MPEQKSKKSKAPNRKPCHLSYRSHLTRRLNKSVHVWKSAGGLGRDREGTLAASADRARRLYILSYHDRVSHPRARKPLAQHLFNWTDSDRQAKAERKFVEVARIPRPATLRRAEYRILDATDEFAELFDLSEDREHRQAVVRRAMEYANA
jgi:hypothetical protein